MEVDGETLIMAGWGLASRFPTWSPLTSQVGETLILSDRNENHGFLLGFLWHHSGGCLVSSLTKGEVLVPHSAFASVCGHESHGFSVVFN